MSLRLYRTSWLVAAVALVVALLTLQSPGPSPEPDIPPVFDATTALTLSTEFGQAFPERPPGSPAGEASADWVAKRFQEVLQAAPTAGAAATAPKRVQRERFVVRRDGIERTLDNVYAALPPNEQPFQRGVLLVVAPRDTPRGVTGGSSSTAALVELARAATARARSRPLIFLSTDGSTTGNAGMRWFLRQNSSLPIHAAVVLDAPGEAGGDAVSLWADGRTDRQALDMSRYAEQAVGRTGGSAQGTPALGHQLLRLGVPQTFGDQGPLIASGVPAVTLSGRDESPLRSTAAPTLDRLALVGRSAESLLGALESADTVPRPDSSVAFAGRRLRPSIALITLLLLCVPIFVLAVDGLARARRARLRVGRGMRAVWWRIAPALVALLAAHLLSLASLLPPSMAGVPPIPQDVALDGPAAAGLIATALAAFLAWLACRPRRLAARALPPEEAAAAVVLLAASLAVLWVLHPYGLVLVLPAAHAALLVTLARRTWQVAAAAVVAVLPLLALCVSIGGTIDRGVVGAAWYILATGAAGARGWSGPVLAVVIGGAVWSIAGLVAFRARKGLVTGGEIAPVAIDEVSPPRDARR